MLSICLVLCHAFPYLQLNSHHRTVLVIIVLVFWGLNPGGATCHVCCPGLVRLCSNHRPAQVSEFVHNTGLVLSLEKPSQGALPYEGAAWVRLPSLIAPPGRTVPLQLLLLGKEHWESLLEDAVTWKGSKSASRSLPSGLGNRNPPTCLEGEQGRVRWAREVFTTHMWFWAHCLTVKLQFPFSWNGSGNWTYYYYVVVIPSEWDMRT